MNQRLRIIYRDWHSCVRCPLGQRAYKHCLWDKNFKRGLPDVMFIGEGPGEVEDIMGYPFRGPAGRLLRQTVRKINEPLDLKIVYTNLVACRPTDGKGLPNRKPIENEIKACRPRLQGTIEGYLPRVIVGLGRIPEENLPATVQGIAWDGSIFNTYHPSHLRRSGGVNAPQYEEWVSDLTRAFQTASRLREETSGK